MQRVKAIGTTITALVLSLALMILLLPATALAADTLPDSAVTLTFSDSGITASGAESGYKIEGTALTINQTGVYTITGSCAEGSIKVKKETTGVTLILRDLTLTTSGTAPLSCNKSTQTTLYIAGTVTLTDAEDPADEDSADTAIADAFEGAAIKVKSGASLTIQGTGALNIDGSACKNGIKGAASSTITIDSGVINVTAANTGIASDNQVIIHGGTITVNAQNDGIKASPDEDDSESLGNILIDGGTVTVSAGDDGIHAGSDTVRTDGGDLTINGGSITVSAGDDGLHAEFDVTINGMVNVTKSYEGVEGARVTFEGGSGTIVASDDGVNAATSQVTTDISLTIQGGTWTVISGGDGLDAGGNSNRGGDFTIHGGVTEVFSSGRGNGALDFDGAGTYTGGTLLAIGNDMIQYPASIHCVVFGAQGGMGGMGPRSEGETITSELLYAGPGMGNMGGMGGMGNMGGMGQQSVTIPSGSTVAILDSDGNTVYSTTARTGGSYLIFFSEQIQSGESYTLSLNGSSAASGGSGSQSQQSDQPGQIQQPGQTQQPGQNQQPGQTQQSDQDQSSGQTEPTLPSAPADDFFTDVAENAWYYEAVRYVQTAGLMKGNGDGTFAPEQSISRAETAQILYNLAGEGDKAAGSAFSDVSAGAWYNDAVAWAARLGYVKGDQGLFRPEDDVTREELVTMLYRYAAGYNLGLDRTSDPAAFPDGSQVSDWAEEAMAWAVGNGVIRGNDDGSLNPGGTAARSEMAQILMNFVRRFSA